MNLGNRSILSTIIISIIGGRYMKLNKTLVSLAVGTPPYLGFANQIGVIHSDVIRQKYIEIQRKRKDKGK